MITFMCIIPFLALINLTQSARILVIAPTPAFSHQLIMRTIYKELSLRGHIVIAFATNPLNDKALTNLTEINMSYVYQKYLGNPNFENLHSFYKLLVVRHIQRVLSEVAEEFLTHPEMKKLVDDRMNPATAFDLLLVEWSVNPALTVLSKVFNCPMVGVRPLDLRLEGHDSVANPTNPSYIPVGYMDHQPSFWGRLDNTLFSILWRLQYHFILVPEAQRIASEHFPHVLENVENVEKSVSIILINTNPVLTVARPMVPCIVEIGGVHLGRENHVIPKDIQKYLDSGTNGVVYFNLGTNVSSKRLDQNIIKIIISSFEDLPYKVIWKFEDENALTLPLNVKTWKWLPQEGILAHPNVKVFVTHGGLQSFEEAVSYNVPLIGIPFFADNHINVQRMVKLGVGKRLDIATLTKEKLVTAIKEVVENITYKENLVKTSRIFHDQPMKPLEKAMWWIEYVIRYKEVPHLRTSAVDMNWFTYLLLDVYLFLLFFVSSFLYSTTFVVIYLVRYFKSGHTRKVKST